MSERTAPDFIPPEDRPAVDVVRPDYQPSVAELEEDMRVGATFEEAVEALVKPVRVRYVDQPKDPD